MEMNALLLREWKRNGLLHIMVLPALVLTVIYSYGPMVGMIIAFKKFMPSKGIFGSEWIGLDNFHYVMMMPDTPRVIANTLVIATLKIVCGLIAPILTALLLNEVRKMAFRRIFQTIVYFPHFLSWVIISGILIDILSPTSGFVNQVLGIFGVKPIFFLGDNRWFQFTLVTSDVWKDFGFGTIVYLAALTNISPSLYEAAEIDGANRWQQTKYITLPGILPIVILLATLSLGNVLNAGFDQILNLYSPSVYESGDIIDTLVYRLGLHQYQYGVATAVGFFRSVVSLILITISYYAAYRLANYRIF
ncbi:ABC transporter permease [Paenibacillus cymbidii]|uniref:ABC transporter permease n=1 Tax=Paenibacillus cymbidii TaxID=1639034 RepID=UPI0038B2A5E0